MLKGRWRELHSDPLRLGNNDGLKWRVHRWGKKCQGYVEHESPPDLFSFFFPFSQPLVCWLFVFNAADLGQRDHLHLRQSGGGVPQAPDGPGPQADLPGHLQLHQVAHQAGV